MVVDFVPVAGQATKIYLVDARAHNEGWLRFLFSSEGRISRKRYWLSYFLPILGVYFLAAFLDVIIANGAANPPAVFRGLATLFFLWPAFAVVAKRLHDRGYSGWWAAVANGLLPVIILSVAAYWYYTNKMRVAESTESVAHDAGGAIGFQWVIVGFALVWLYFAIQVAFVRGQIGENKYGDDPLPTQADIRSDNIVTAVFGTIAALLFLVLPVSAYWYYSNKMKSPEDQAATQDGDTQELIEGDRRAPTPEELGLIPLEDDTPSSEGRSEDKPADAAAPEDGPTSR
jgi:uncharacterized membrane protein YhaH (DUF805 family)